MTQRTTTSMMMKQRRTELATEVRALQRAAGETVETLEGFPDLESEDAERQLQACVDAARKLRTLLGGLLGRL